MTYIVMVGRKTADLAELKAAVMQASPSSPITCCAGAATCLLAMSAFGKGDVVPDVMLIAQDITDDSVFGLIEKLKKMRVLRNVRYVVLRQNPEVPLAKEVLALSLPEVHTVQDLIHYLSGQAG